MDRKIWFITGISSGIGQALARAAVSQGDFVVGTFRNSEQTQRFNENHVGKALGLTVDITNPDDVAQSVHTVRERFGRLDVLVNNAGYGLAGAIEETSNDETRAIFETNFFGALAVTQAFLPLMRAQGSGHIIQLSSHTGVKSFPGFGIYSASKFALEGMSEALAAEVAPLGIRVTIVEPGPFRTSFANGSFHQAAQQVEAYSGTAGAFRERMKAVNGKQEGDPKKAAEAIVSVVNHENPPLRLPLGKVAVGTLTAKLASVQQDLDAWRSVAEGAVFEQN
jgi:NAD(P)-dependent dehydrogenase (short-subunit alcohol dehydrogenase family)